MKVPLSVLGLVLVGMLASFVGCKDRFTWLLEVGPIVLAAPILIGTYRRFPMTSLVYVLVGVHAAVLMIGAHWTYAEVPAGFWVKDAVGLARNPYDRVGHFAQGFFPAIVAREVLVRTSPLRPGRWLFFLVTCVCLAFSALYELVEWWAALLSGEKADAFLGTQGDPWDTQWDMFMCLVGALTSQLGFARIHDGQMKEHGLGTGTRTGND